MSSKYVREKVKQFIATNAPTEHVIEFSALYQTVDELIQDNGLGHDDPWLGLDFIGDDETPITIGSNNVRGKYRETGAVQVHVVSVATAQSAGNILDRAETLRNLFRGISIDRVHIETVSPINFGAGAALQFEGGYVSGTFVISYQCDLDM